MKVKFIRDRGKRSKGEVYDYDDERYAQYLIDSGAAQKFTPKRQTKEEKGPRDAKD